MNKRKILVVEDDRDQLMGLSAMLRMGGYDVIAATEGVAGIAKARSDRPDLVLLDLGLPAGNGFWFLETLRASPEVGQTPVIVLTAMDSSRAKEKAFSAGADGFGQKPIDADDLLRSIEGLLKRVNGRAAAQEPAARRG
ncbi:MAG: response regulator [Thermoanaerobaculia bacterium]|nr:response regulator [Thermoanaerobaculia bacterium]